MQAIHGLSAQEKEELQVKFVIHLRGFIRRDENGGIQLHSRNSKPLAECSHETVVRAFLNSERGYDALTPQQWCTMWRNGTRGTSRLAREICKLNEIMRTGRKGRQSAVLPAIPVLTPAFHIAPSWTTYRDNKILRDSTVCMKPLLGCWGATSVPVRATFQIAGYSAVIVSAREGCVFPTFSLPTLGELGVKAPQYSITACVNIWSADELLGSFLFTYHPETKTTLASPNIKPAAAPPTDDDDGDDNDSHDESRQNANEKSTKGQDSSTFGSSSSWPSYPSQSATPQSSATETECSDSSDESDWSAGSTEQEEEEKEEEEKEEEGWGDDSMHMSLESAESEFEPHDIESPTLEAGVLKQLFGGQETESNLRPPKVTGKTQKSKEKLSRRTEDSGLTAQDKQCRDRQSQHNQPTPPKARIALPPSSNMAHHVPLVPSHDAQGFASPVQSVAAGVPQWLLARLSHAKKVTAWWSEARSTCAGLKSVQEQLTAELQALRVLTAVKLRGERDRAAGRVTQAVQENMYKVHTRQNNA
jgi:hypothetical protein